jgi:hypothetical protein
MNAQAVNFLLACWGALTGTIAIVIQLRQHLADRSRLKLSAVMSIASNEKLRENHLVFTLEVVNHGRRVSRIRCAGIQLQPSETIIAGKTFPRATRWEIRLYDADRSGGIVELAEGGLKRFVLEPFPEKEAQTLRDTEVAFVTDTHGRKYTTKFHTIKPKDLPKH